MKIIHKISWDIATGTELERDDFFYEGSLELCGPSDAQKTAQEQAQSEANTMQADFSSQFKEQQGLLNSFLIPQLEGMISDPQGFGATAIADMNANLVNTTGAQALNATKAANASFDTQNMAGLPSGVQQVIKSQIASGAGNEVAQGTNQIQLANAQEKLQQQQFGLQQLPGAEAALGAAPQTGQLSISANQNSANQAYQMAQQGTWWQGLLGGALQAGLGFATGGLSTLASGAGGVFSGGSVGGQSDPALGTPSYMNNGPVPTLSAPQGPGGFGTVPK
jgi:hypothetical protein